MIKYNLYLFENLFSYDVIPIMNFANIDEAGIIDYFVKVKPGQSKNQNIIISRIDGE